MSSSPRPAATACLTKKWLVAGPPARASLAENTITRPKNISRTTVVKSTLSNASFFAMGPSRDVADQLLEDLAAVDEVAELIEAGAGRRQHDGVARPRLGRGGFDGAVHGAGDLERHGAAERGLEVAGRLADQVGAAGLAADHGRQHGEVGVLVAAAEDQVDGAVGEPLDGLQGGAGVGALGVVIEEDAGPLPHLHGPAPPAAEGGGGP